MSKEVSISLEFTPNPNTLKFVVDVVLMPSGAANFPDKASVNGKSPLADILFGISGVAAVMIGKNFVTITKGDDGDWEDLNNGVTAALTEHLTSGKEVVDASLMNAGPTGTGDGDIENKIRHILDTEIRPAVAQDGGDITFDKFVDGVVYLYLQGSCAGCPSSTATLKQGIEQRLQRDIPEIKEVVSV